MASLLSRAIIVMAFLGFVAPAPLRAQTQTWTGAASNAWADPANWSTAVPGFGGTGLFNGPGNGNVTIDLGGAARPIGTILFDTAAAAAYTFSGNPGDAFTFDAAGAVTVNATVTTSQTFNTPLQFRGAFTATNNGTGLLTFNGNTALATGGAAGLLTVTGTGNTTVNGVIGLGSVSGLTKTGTGQLALTAANTFTGGTSVTAGSIRLANSLALQSSTLTVGVANGVIFDSSVAGNAFSLGGLAGAAATGNFALQNNAATPAPITLTIGNNNANTTYTGTMSGGGSIIKVGTGTTTLTGGTSSFTGNVTVNGGTLGVTTANNGANSSLGARIAGRTITVNAGATLLFNTNNIFGGGGNLAANLPAIVVNGGTVSSTRYNMIPNITLNGATLFQNANDTTAQAGGAFQGYQFIGTVTVTGTSPSTISVGANGRGNHLLGTGSANTTFNVADVTGDSYTDLTVTTPLLNGSGDYGNNAASGLTKTGAGTMRLSAGNLPAQTNAYSGPTIVGAGTLLAIPTAIKPTNTVTVADGATFGVFNTTSTANVPIATLNLGASAGGGLTTELSGVPTLAPIDVTTAFTTAGTNAVNVSSTTQLPVGQFPLVHYAGTIGGAGFGGLTLGSLPPRVTATLVNNTANQTVDLNVTSSDSIRWNGNVNSVWDINTTPNWVLNTAGTAATYLQPTVPGEPVLFNDLATGTFDVTIPSAVNPISVTVDNTTHNYSFSGSPITLGTVVIKNGTGTLTLLNNNTFTGGLTINAGTVSVGNGGTTGSLGAGPVTDNAALVFNRSDAVTVGTAIAGTGSLTQAGSGNLTLTGFNTYTGGTTVNAGTLTLAVNGGGTGVVRGTVTVNAGAQLVTTSANALGFTAGVKVDVLNVNGGTVTTTANGDQGWAITMNLTSATLNATATGARFSLGGGSAINSLASATPSTINGSVVLREGNTNDTLTVTVADGAAPVDLSFTGVVSGNAATRALLKDGPGLMQMTAANTYTGPTTISAGTLQLGDGTTSGSLASTTITNNAALVLNPGPTNVSLAGAVGGTGTVTKIGPNTATFAGANNYTGDTNVTAGVLRYAPAAAANAATVAALNVAAAGKLAVASFNTSGTVLTVGTLNLAADGAGVNFELAGATTAAPLLVNTAFTTTATNPVNVSSVASLAVGQFPLLKYPGTIGGSGFSALALGTLPPRVLATLVNNTANQTVDLNVTGTDTIRWDGTVNGAWDINTTPNWKTIVSNVGTNYLQPTAPGDIVTFDDQAAGNFTVTLPATVTPASVTLNNSTHDYAFTGPGAIAGTFTLVKNGTGKVTFSNPTSFTGGATINAGTVVLANDTAFSGAVAINTGGTFVLANNTAYAGAVTINTGGTLSVGNGGTAGLLPTAFTNNGTLAFNHSDNIVIGTLLSGAGIVVQQGTGSVQLTNLNNSFTGDLIVASGTLLAANALNPTASANSSMGAQLPGRTIRVNAGATLSFPSNNAFAGGGSAASLLPQLVVSGLVTSTRYNALPNVTLNGGTLDQSATDTGTYNGYQFLGTVTVGGTSPSAITTGNGKGNHLLPGVPTEFIVADVTGGPSASLVVSTPLLDGSGDYPGSAGLTKSGPGVMLLTAASTYTGPTTINAGTLQLGNGTLTATLASTSIVDNAVLALNPGPANTTLGIAISGTGGVTKLGANAATFTAANNYTGDTNINGGILRYRPGTAGNVATAGTINVGAAGTLALTSYDTAGTVLNAGTLSLSATGAAVNFELLGNTTAAPIVVSTAFTTAGGNPVNVTSSSPLAVGQFPLIHYPGTIGGSGFGGLTVGSLPLRVLATLVNNTANQTVDLNVSGTDTIRWNGTVNGTWDVNTTPNWKTVSGGADTTYLQPTAPGDIVAFNDLAANNFTVNIPATVTPTSVTVDNTTHAYTFTGPGAIAGTFALVKNGTGTLTVANDNTYAGGTTINAGTVVVGNGGTAGSLGTGAITDNGALAFNRSDAITIGVVISGTGTVTQQGAGSVQLTNLGNSFTGDLIVASGTLIAANALNPTASANSSLGAQSSARTIRVNAGATLSFPSNNTFAGGGSAASLLPQLVVSGLVTSTRYNALPNITLNGGTLDQSSTDGGNYEGYQFLGTVTVGGTAPSTISTGNGKGNHLLPVATEFIVADVTGGAGPSLVVSTPLLNGSGDYPGVAGLTKSGAGIMLLSGANRYTGPTAVNGGTLIVTGNNAAMTGAVSVAPSATLRGTNALGGNVSVNGSIGAGTTSVGTLTLANGLAVNSGGGILVKLAGAANPDPTGTGGSTVGTLPNPTSNSFLNVTGGTTVIDLGALVTVDGTGASITPNQAYSYQIVGGAGDQSGLSVTNQSQFTAVGFAATNFSMTGNSGGAVFVNFTAVPVPEPALVFTVCLAGFAVSYVRRRRPA